MKPPLLVRLLLALPWCVLLALLAVASAVDWAAGKARGGRVAPRVVLR